jgi:prophage tail gpP-like protein
MKPFRILIDGSELVTYTNAKLHRSKDQMTGELNVDVFFNYIPQSPVAVDAVRGREITVYIMGNLAFTGVIDKRKGRNIRPRDEEGRFTSTGGKGSQSGSGDATGSLTENGYVVTITARGKTKYLVDSSHKHPTTNIKNTSDRKVIEALIKDHNIELDWRATELKAPLVRLRDGTRVVTEIFSQCNENCHFVYETREGKLLVTDDTNGTVGDAIVLGQNILSFNAEQSEDQANSEITVKGHRTDSNTWGKDAIVTPVETVKDEWVGANIPLVIQHYGDATPEALQRRAKFEADKRSSESKKVNVTVFHVQSSGGVPWDIGNLHYVEIPCEGIFDVMECIDLTYEVDANNTLQTSLVLAPPPSSGISGGASGVSSGLMSTNSLSSISDLVSQGVSRRIQAGVQLIAGQYPSSWSGAALSAIANPVTIVTTAINSLLRPTSENEKTTPPLKLTDET